MVTSPKQITKDKLTKDHLDEDCLQNWPFLNSMASKSVMQQFATFWECGSPVNTLQIQKVMTHEYHNCNKILSKSRVMTVMSCVNVLWLPGKGQIQRGQV